MGAKLVIIESPFAGKTEVERARNLAYVRAAMADCFTRGEVPFASHALYTQPGVLDDLDPAQRKKGIDAGFVVAKAFWNEVTGGDAESFMRAFYCDRAWSEGMVDGVADAASNEQPWERRKLGPEWSKDNDCLYYLKEDGTLVRITPANEPMTANGHNHLCDTFMSTCPACQAFVAATSEKL